MLEYVLLFALLSFIAGAALIFSAVAIFAIVAIKEHNND